MSQNQGTLPTILVDLSFRYAGTLLHATHIDADGNAQVEFPISFGGGRLRSGRRKSEYFILTLELSELVRIMALFQNLIHRIPEVQAMAENAITVISQQGTKLNREVTIKPIVRTLVVATSLPSRDESEAEVVLAAGTQVSIWGVCDPTHPYFYATIGGNRSALIPATNVENGADLATRIFKQAAELFRPLGGE
ncbi:hypothetical protein HGA91_06440 [candidate division WWE3 bacterium]|nr:hypothetical protein [candidate division WWE3 bacterium]